MYTVLDDEGNEPSPEARLVDADDVRFSLTQLWNEMDGMPRCDEAANLLWSYPNDFPEGE